MTTEAVRTAAPGQPQGTPAEPPSRPRLWPPVVLVLLYWGFHIVLQRLDLPFFVVFLAAMASCVLLTLPFIIWWLANWRIPFGERLLGLGVAAAGGTAAALLCDQTLGTFGVLFMGLPFVVTAWTV